MTASLLLAKLMGPMLLVMGLFILVRPQLMRDIGREFLKSDALIFLSGMITLPVGLAIVVTHNVWAADWRGIITMFGWIMVFAGLARIAIPDRLRVLGAAMLDRMTLLAVPGILMAAIGAWLSYQGYIA